MSDIPEEVIGFFKENALFWLCAHASPDADAIGAEYALHGLLGWLGKEARVINADSPPQKYSFIDKKGMLPPKGAALPEAPAAARFVVLDTNDLLNLGPPGDLIRAAPGKTLIIDHHEPKNAPECAAWIDSARSSTSEMVFSLYEALGAPIGRDEAEALFAGISYDTGSFIYPKTSAATFEAARRLVEAGVAPYEMHSLMHESSTIGALKLETAVLSKLEFSEGDRVALLRMGKDDIARAGAAYDDAEDFINFPLKAKSVEVSVFVKEREDGSLRCSLRSKGGVNVARIAQRFGGGGHRTAAGFKCREGLEDTRRKVLDMIAEELRS